MQSKSAEVAPRNFNPMSVPALSEEARKAVNAAFDAMSAWRTEMVSNSEKNSGQVIEKMAAAARALGWPDQIVEATRAQMQSITKTQIETMDHVMDAWEEQIKSPNPASAMLSKLKSLPSLGSAGGWPMPGFGQAGSWPNADAFQMAAMNPLRFYMQFAEQCQRRAGRTRWPSGSRPGSCLIASDSVATDLPGGTAMVPARRQFLYLAAGTAALVAGSRIAQAQTLSLDLVA